MQTNMDGSHGDLHGTTLRPTRNPGVTIAFRRLQRERCLVLVARLLVLGSDTAIGALSASFAASSA